MTEFVVRAIVAEPPQLSFSAFFPPQVPQFISATSGDFNFSTHVPHPHATGLATGLRGPRGFGGVATVLGHIARAILALAGSATAAAIWSREAAVVGMALIHWFFSKQDTDALE